MLPVAVKPGAANVHSFSVGLHQWNLRGRNRIGLSWVYRNDRAEVERERWEGRERETVTYSGIWTGEVRSGTIHCCLGVPWYGGVLGALILLLGVTLAVKGLRIYKEKRLGAEPVA